jgi:PAS domain S-box-containing protein
MATLFLALVLLLLPSIGRAQQAATPKRILLLYWNDRDYAGNIAFEQTFRAGLQSAPTETFEYYSEYLESNRFPGEKQSSLLRDYLRTKYADRNIDVILAVTDQPLAFLLKYRQELFTGIPIVFVAVQSPTAAELAAGPGITGIVYGGNQSSTLDLALRFHPGTEHVFIVSGTLEHDRRFEIPARQDLEGHESRVSITYLTDLPLGELTARASSLPERSIILYLWQQSLDDQGNVLESPDVIALIARSARVPIYGLANPVLGSGIVGGNLRSPWLMAARAAEMALRIANGARAGDIPVEPPVLAPMFDWRQLKRWGISEGNLPPGSIVRFKEPTLWEQYKWSIISFIAFCFGQTLLIVGLFVQRSRRKRVERALGERELRLRESQAIAHVGSFHWDVVADTVTWSDEMYRIHGFEPGELSITYETYLDRVHPDDREQVRRAVERSLTTQEPIEHEYRIVQTSGETRWVFAHGRPVVDSGGKFVALQGTCQDITERKRASDSLRDSEMRNQAMLEAIPDMMFLLSRDGVYLDFHGQDPSVLLIQPEQFVGKSIHDVMPPELAEQFGKCLQEVTRSGQSGLVEYSLPILGEQRHYEARVVNCDVRRVLILLRDMTEHKHADEALRRSHAELEWRTHQLRRLASDLTLAEQHVREQLAKTLHDGLQQLLFSALMTLNRVLTAGQVTLLQRARADINEAMEAARTLSVNLFPPILHIAGLPAALAWLAKRTEQQYSVVVNVAANPDANPTTSDVRILLFEAVRELLFNAVKHAHVDRIDVSLAVGSDDTIQIAVSDEGVGFEPAVILHHKNLAQRGLGLFSIEERLASFGGHLDIQSAPGKGARFTLTLPRTDLLRPEPGGRSHDAGWHERLVYDAADVTSKPLRILIADDHVVARAGLRELLSERPTLQVVAEAANGVEAISQAMAVQPAVIVMDVSMPQMNGIEATLKIRGSMPHIHIVGLSTYDDENSERAMREAGAEAYFTKNEGPDRLLNYLLSLQTKVKGARTS